MLQITDIHIDPSYEPGSNAECGEPNCCRFDQGQPTNLSAGAGYWGDYRDCDTPIHAFQDLLQDAASRHPVTIAILIF
jgi:sphingomyelin phosphodiesterase